MFPKDVSTAFREFDEDDVDSYLEGSVWSEKPSAEMYCRHTPDEVVTVFPSTADLSHYPATSCETVFTIRRPASNRSSQIRPPSDELIYNIQRPRSGLESPANITNYKNGITRPGSPGPVAGVGDITNTEHGFTIELDVKLFRPEEIKVVLNDNHLSITGERIEQCGDGQTLRRSFTRKYSIPSDVHLDSIRSHLADNGILYINGSRRGWKETNLIYHGTNNSMYGRSGSVISTV